MLAAAVSLFPACFFLKKGTLLMLVLLGSLSLLYSIPLFKIRNERINLRKIPGVKAFLISLIWTLSTIWIPLYEMGLPLNTLPVFLVYAGRFLFIFSVCIAFDIRDMDQDSRKKLYTIPVLIGEQRSKILISFMLIIDACILYVNADKLFTGHRLALLTGILVCICLLATASRKRNEYFYHFWLDGIFIFQYLLVLLL